MGVNIIGTKHLRYDAEYFSFTLCRKAPLLMILRRKLKRDILNLICLNQIAKKSLLRRCHVVNVHVQAQQSSWTTVASRLVNEAFVNSAL